MLIDENMIKEVKTLTNTHASKREGGDLKYTFILQGKQKVNKVMNNAYKVKKY